MATGLIYRPLHPREIRLLRLHPGSPTDESDTVKCDLFHASLDDEALRYHALSYCWDESTPQRQIFVNSEQVGIASSLESALRTLRLSSDNLVIWADAICINQSDTAERSQQVQQMGRVYRQSDIVHAWLGNAPNDSRIDFQAIQLWKDSASERRSLALNLRLLQEILPGLTTEWVVSGAPPINDFISRPYWGRLWVIPELALARQAVVHFGHQKIDLEYLLDLIPAIRAIFVLLADFREHLGTVQNFRTDTSNVWNIANMLEFLQKAQSRLRGETSLSVKLLASLAFRNSTDPRDKIYAFEAAVDQNSPDYELVRPDYSKGVAQVYTDFARYAIGNGETYDILRLSAAIMSNSAEAQLEGLPLPSWAPDWRGTAHYWGQYKRGNDSTTPSVMATCNEHGGIWVRSRKLDIIRQLLKVPTFLTAEYTDVFERQEVFGRFLLDFVYADTLSVNGRSRLSGLFELTRPEPDAEEADRVHHVLAMFYQVLLDFLSSLDLESDDVENHTYHIGYALLPPGSTRVDIEVLRTLAARCVTEKWSRGFVSMSQWRINNTSVFLTCGGRMGCGSHKKREGDGIYCLAPDDATFVLSLEPSADGSVRWFKNAGECYVLDLDTETPGSGDMGEGDPGEATMSLPESDYVDMEIR